MIEVELPDPAARTVLLEGLSELGIQGTEAQTNALLAIAGLLSAWAGRINLTAHRGPEAVVRRLILEAAAVSVLLGEIESLADLGSGAGFPGLPLAVFRPRCQVTLVESRERRHHFQRAALRATGLENVRLECGRAEALVPRPHQAAIAQALGPPTRAVAWMVPWVRPGGMLFLPGTERERPAPPHPEVRWELCHRYRVPCRGPLRTLWQGRRLPA